MRKLERYAAARAFLDIAWSAKASLEGWYDERYSPLRWLQLTMWLHNMGIDPWLLSMYQLSTVNGEDGFEYTPEPLRLNA